MVELAKNLEFLVIMIRLVEHTALSPAQHRRVTALLYILVLADSLEIEENSGILKCSKIISQKLQPPFCVDDTQVR